MNHQLARSEASPTHHSCGCPPGFSGVTIDAPANRREWDASARLVLDLFSWIEASSNLKVTGVQADALSELADLPRAYAWPTGRFLIARLGHEVVGTTAVRLQEPGLAELKRVWVAPHARGRHLAGALLHEALTAARQLGAASIRLETMPSIMSAAVRIYAAHGFRPIPGYSTLSQRDDILAMELPLAA